MLKILQAKLQHYVNQELPDVQAGFRKSRRTRDQIANICWVIEKAREFQKKIYFCFIDYTKAFDCVDHNKPWKILKEMGIPDHLICLLRNLYAGQEATVRTGHGTTDRKRSTSDCKCHLVYLTYIQSTSCEMLGWMKLKLESRLLGEVSITSEEVTEDTTLVAESKEELKSLLMKVKEESEIVGLKFNIQKKIMVSGPIISWQIDKETVETVSDFISWGFKITADSDWSHEIKRAYSLEGKL